MKRSEDMNGWEIAGAIIGVVLVIVVLANIKDLCRYLKISSM
ncbi:hypothetical+protein [Methylocapsa aurea]